MAAPGISFKAVGASLDTLAKRCQELPRSSVGALAYANSGVLQQVGKIMHSRYIVAGRNAVTGKSGYTQYTQPAGATHGPISVKKFSKHGERFGRDERGRWRTLKPEDVASTITTERKLFVKGKFVDRTGAMLGAADDLRSADPSVEFPRLMSEAETGQKGKRSEVSVGIDANGLGYVELKDGYAAAERGTRSRVSSPVRGWWRALRTASGQWGKLLNKKYPDLLRLGK